MKKVIEEPDKEKALELETKLEFLKKLNDPKNIFLDFSSNTKGGVFGKTKIYKFKIYYKYERNYYKILQL